MYTPLGSPNKCLHTMCHNILYTSEQPPFSFWALQAGSEDGSEEHRSAPQGAPHAASGEDVNNQWGRLENGRLLRKTNRRLEFSPGHMSSGSDYDDPSPALLPDANEKRVHSSAGKWMQGVRV